MGVVGLGYEDFCALTPAETACVFSAYREKSDGSRRDAWERMRLGACIGIQPYVKKRLSPSALLPLPWDNKKAEPVGGRNYTDEERRARRRLILERWKNGKGSQV